MRSCNTDIPTVHGIDPANVGDSSTEEQSTVAEIVKMISLFTSLD